MEPLLVQALRLSAAERAELAGRLLESLDNPDEGLEPEVEALWLTHSARRAAEIDEGRVKLVPGEQMMREALALRR